VRARSLEFWTGGVDRMHERVRYERKSEHGWSEGVFLAP